MNWKIHVHCRVRNESIGYIVFIDRAKPDNCVRINPATRHFETKYGFVILTGDMIFKDFFVRVKLLLSMNIFRAPRPIATKSTHSPRFKDKAARRLTFSPFDRRPLSVSKTALERTAKGTHRRCGDGCLPVDPSRSSMAAQLNCACHFQTTKRHVTRPYETSAICSRRGSQASL